ncbi:MAG: hypothetical protein QXH30_01770 [Candidatus Bilamarchaeaceae archaeon]
MRAIKTKGGFGKIPKAFACGMLEDEGRMLFLAKKDANGIEKATLPSVLVHSGRSPVAEIQDEFLKQAGIEAQVEGVVFEWKHNYGTRRRKAFVPLLVFALKARRMQAKPSPEFTGFRWIPARHALLLDKRREIRLEKWVCGLLRKMLEAKKPLS